MNFYNEGEEPTTTDAPAEGTEETTPETPAEPTV